MASASASAAVGAASGGSGGVVALIAQREQELAQLRLGSIQALQQQVGEGPGLRAGFEVASNHCTCGAPSQHPSDATPLPAGGAEGGGGAGAWGPAGGAAG